MNFREFRKLAEYYWRENRASHAIPGDARVITGNPHNDAFFYYMLKDNGVELILEQERRPTGGLQWRLTNYRVVDEKKFTWFLLRWS